MGHVLSFTHCKDAPSTASSTPDSCPPDDMEERREDRQYKKEEKKEGQKMTRMLRTPLDIRINVKDLLYWRDTLLSAGCLTGVTLSLLCLSQFSVISVLSYGCLIVLSATLALRLYTQLMHALKRGSGANPFQQYLDADLTLSTQQVEAITARALSVFCSTAGTLRSLFLVQDVRESLKFLVLLYLLTYVGAVFNGLTLLLLCVIGAFTFPILYKQHQTQVDCYVSLVSKKLNGIRASVRALFKKPAAKQK
ncbi:reticulon-2 isoform 3-T3 [Rhinophrynus dorsalis]